MLPQWKLATLPTATHLLVVRHYHTFTRAPTSPLQGMQHPELRRSGRVDLIYKDLPTPFPPPLPSPTTTITTKFPPPYLCREIDSENIEDCWVQPLEYSLSHRGLPCPHGTHHQHWTLSQDQRVHEVVIAQSVDSRNKDFIKRCATGENAEFAKLQGIDAALCN